MGKEDVSADRQNLLKPALWPPGTASITQSFARNREETSMRRFHVAVLLLTGTGLLACSAFAVWWIAFRNHQPEQPHEVKIAGNMQYPTGEPQIPPSLGAELAIKKFKIPQGLKVDLVASEPLLANPVAFCFGERGQIYVAETFRLGAGVL